MADDNKDEKTFEAPAEKAEPKKAPAKKKSPVKVKKSPTAVRKQKRAKKVTFAQYAKQKGFKDRHVPGLQAYCDNPNKLRTLDEWDAHFKGY